MGHLSLRNLIASIFLAGILGSLNASEHVSSSQKTCRVACDSKRCSRVCTQMKKKRGDHDSLREDLTMVQAGGAEKTDTLLSNLIEHCQNTLTLLRTFKPQNYPLLDQDFYQSLFQKTEMAVAKLSTVKNPNQHSFALVERCQTLLEILQDIVARTKQSQDSKIEISPDFFPAEGRLSMAEPDAVFHVPIRQRSKKMSKDTAPKLKLSEDDEELLEAETSPQIYYHSHPQKRRGPTIDTISADDVFSERR